MSDKIFERLELLRTELARAERRVARAQSERDKLRDRVTAYEAVIHDLSGAGSEDAEAVVPPSKPSAGAIRPSIADLVRDALPAMASTFDAVQVFDFLRESWPDLVPDSRDARATVGALLSRMARIEQLRIVRAGAGRRPAVYAHSETAGHDPPD